jgi:glycosyltransferase involved in cell wall biosynthesis
MSDLVSIVTTLYNYAQYVGDLAESIKNQTHDNWEWIIVDDCSTDNPLAVIQKSMCDCNYKYIKLDKNMGYSYAKNVGIKNTKGNYIVMIDADDMLTEKSISSRKFTLDMNPQKLWCHGESLVLCNGKLNEDSRKWKRNFRAKLISQGVDLNKQYHHRLIHAQTVMVRPELHKKYGLYDETLRFSSDNEMWRRLIRFGEIPVHIEDYVSIYRVHNKRMCQSKYKKQRISQVKKQIISDVEKRFKEGINNNNTVIWE